ncbi:unnamed protein product [Staurois parvus]|uniref:Uncharacterized protein n=1 Tax=Staurois parvus TaxID=386267 RepID=A0ABN9AJT0_9NEOB|nr:unnamed protein product [Staurois parvus]
MSQMDLLHSGKPNLSRYLRANHSFSNVEAVCMPRCLILYTCGHGGDWNT